MLEADGLVVVDFDLFVDPVLYETLKDGSVDFAEELSGVLLVRGDDDEAVVVDYVTRDVAVVARAAAAVVLAAFGHHTLQETK